MTSTSERHRGIRKFCGDRRGATAMMFAGVALMVIGAAGAALDYSRAVSTRNALQDAADAVALAVARSPSPWHTRKAMGEQMWNGMMASVPNLKPPYPSATIVQGSGNRVTVTASGQVDATLLGALGISSLAPGVRSVAVLGANVVAPNGVEIVFAFDATASMALRSHWTAALQSMNAAINSIASAAGSGNVFLTYMPWTDRVNVSAANTVSNWLNVPVPANWNGCLEPREETVGGNPYALTDRPPSALRFAPTANPYLISDLGNVVYGTTSPPNLPKCLGQPITLATSSTTQITNAIQATTANGTGRMDEAMAWAWRLLSPNWRGLWTTSTYPSNYGDRRKIVVYVSDGFTAAYKAEVGGASGGWIAHPGVAVGAAGSRAGFENMVDVCSAMKAKGIEIYMISASTTHPVWNSYARQCASDPSHFYTATDGSGLKIALDGITSAALTGSGPAIVRLEE